jgi:hypothetical protein
MHNRVKENLSMSMVDDELAMVNVAGESRCGVGIL